MKESTTDIAFDTDFTQPRFRFLLLYGFFAIIIIIMLVGFLAYQGWSSRSSATSLTEVGYASASVLEERYGIRVTLIGVTAAGGMVDFRFLVLDPQKALQLYNDPVKMPKLIAVEKGIPITVPREDKQIDELVAGRVYFILFPNPGGVVKPGMPVSVVIDELHLEPILAK
jgi:hypothetical protein